MPGTRELLTKTAAAHDQWIADVQRRLEQEGEAARQAQIIEAVKAEVAALRGESNGANDLPQRAGGSATGAARIAKWDANRTLRRTTTPPPAPPTARPRPTVTTTFQPQLLATPRSRPQQPDLQRTLSRYPEFQPWAQGRTWTALNDLDPALLERAQLMAFTACYLSVGGDIDALKLAEDDPHDFETVLQALSRAGHITVEEYTPGRRRWRATTTRATPAE